MRREPLSTSLARDVRCAISASEGHFAAGVLADFDEAISRCDAEADRVKECHRWKQTLYTGEHASWTRQQKHR